MRYGSFIAPSVLLLSACVCTVQIREDNLAIVLLDALSYHEWVSEDKFAEKLGLSSRQVRKILQQLEKQGFVVREHRREKKRGNVVESEMGYEEKGRTATYVSIDYPLMFDMLRLRLHLAKKKATDRIDDGQVLLLNALMLVRSHGRSQQSAMCRLAAQRPTFVHCLTTRQLTLNGNRSCDPVVVSCVSISGRRACPPASCV